MLFRSSLAPAERKLRREGNQRRGLGWRTERWTDPCTAPSSRRPSKGPANSEISAPRTARKEEEPTQWKTSLNKSAFFSAVPFQRFSVASAKGSCSSSSAPNPPCLPHETHHDELIRFGLRNVRVLVADHLHERRHGFVAVRRAELRLDEAAEVGSATS